MNVRTFKNNIMTHPELMASKVKVFKMLSDILRIFHECSIYIFHYSLFSVQHREIREIVFLKLGKATQRSEKIKENVIITSTYIHLEKRNFVCNLF